jgi:hypothetical protein
MGFPRFRGTGTRAVVVAAVVGVASLGLSAGPAAAAAAPGGSVHVLRASFKNDVDGVGPFGGTVRVTRPEGRPARAAMAVVFDAFPLGGTCADGVTPFTVHVTMRGAGPATLTIAGRRATATGKIRYTRTVVIDNCTGADISDTIAPLLSPDPQPFAVSLTGGEDHADLRHGRGTMSGNDSLGDPFAQPLPARGVFGEIQGG